MMRLLRKLWTVLAHLFRVRTVTVIFLPDDIMRAPTVVGGTKSIRQARKHLKRIGRRAPEPHVAYVDGPVYREACKQRLALRKMN